MFRLEKKGLPGRLPCICESCCLAFPDRLRIKALALRMLRKGPTLNKRKTREDRPHPEKEGHETMQRKPR